MTVKLNNRELNVKSIGGSGDPAGTEWDSWVDAAYKRKYKAYGKVQQITIEFFETDVLWDNSAAKEFSSLMAAGTEVKLYSDDPRRTADTTVFIKQVSDRALVEGNVNMRYCTVTLQEV
jgi:hypothetical protein